MSCFYIDRFIVLLFIVSLLPPRLWVYIARYMWAGFVLMLLDMVQGCGFVAWLLAAFESNIVPTRPEASSAACRAGTNMFDLVRDLNVSTSKTADILVFISSYKSLRVWQPRVFPCRITVRCRCMCCCSALSLTLAASAYDGDDVTPV